MSIHNRKLKVITLDIGGTDFECQVSNWQMVNNADDGDKIYSFCPDGEDTEEVDPDWSLQLTFFSDWTSGGVSDYLMQHAGEVVTFQLDHHPDIPAEHVRWDGKVRLKAPSVGGDVRTTETQEITLGVIGKPNYTRP